MDQPQDPARLYQDAVIAHNRAPRNFRKIQPCTHRADGHNPFCGDEVQLYLRITDERVEEAGFQGESCAIATASASMLTTVVQGRTLSETRELIAAMKALMADAAAAERLPETAAELRVLAAVHRYPGRIQCAGLPWDTLDQALSASGSTNTDAEPSVRVGR